jgi:hypothetical protein
MSELTEKSLANPNGYKATVYAHSLAEILSEAWQLARTRIQAATDEGDRNYWYGIADGLEMSASLCVNGIKKDPREWVKKQ